MTRYPQRFPALDSEILLYDVSSGECISLMDGDWITTMRTGAVAAHSILLLAKENFFRIGFMGLGNTARATLLCLLDAMPNRSFQVGLLKYKNQHESFMKRFTDFKNVCFHIVDDIKSLACESEVLVSCVTAAGNDFCDSDFFSPGSLLVPVHTRGFTNCDLSFDKVFCDDESHVNGFRYYPQFKEKLAEISDVVCGICPGRTSTQERIVAYNIGISLHDVFFAGKIYGMIDSQYTSVDLKKPNEKFWI